MNNFSQLTFTMTNYFHCPYSRIILVYCNQITQDNHLILKNNKLHCAMTVVLTVVTGIRRRLGGGMAGGPIDVVT